MSNKRLKDSIGTGLSQVQEDRACKNCVYFRLHYVRYSRGRYREMEYGHCMEPRLKIRYADNRACQYWQERAESQ